MNSAYKSNHFFGLMLVYLNLKFIAYVCNLFVIIESSCWLPLGWMLCSDELHERISFFAQKHWFAT